MKRFITGCFVVGMIAAPTYLKADTAAATLTVTGQVASSITLTVESADGGTFTNGGTDAATLAVGTVSKFGSTPTGYTKVVGPTSWNLSTQVGVKVLKANLDSASYTLKAKMSTAPAGSVAWSFNGMPLNELTLTDIDLAAAYDTTPTYSLAVEIPDTVADATAFDNVVEYTALSN